MFNNLFAIIEKHPFRGYAVLASLVIIFLLLVWVSIIDIQKKSITFWKMLIVSSSTIILPLIISLFCGCSYLRYFLASALILWLLLLYLNIQYNNDAFVGKADIDLLSALFSLNIAFCAWMYFTSDVKFVFIQITNAWYLFFLYLTLGAIFYLILFLFIFSFQVLFKKATFKQLIKGTKISVIPMLIPISVMIPYMIMTV